MEGKIKKYQKKEFQMRKLPFDENMSFIDAQEAINKIQRQELAEKKNKVIKLTDVVVWTESTGKIIEVDHYKNRCVETSTGIYYISMQEPNLDRFPTGAIVKCIVGNPGNKMGVAKQLELI
jgi:hypothetical protein